MIRELALASRLLRHRVGAAIVGTGATLGVASFTQCQILEPAPPKRSVHEVTMQVSGDIVGEFNHWLPGYLKKLIQLPGLLGAKVLTPPQAAEKPAVVFVLGGPGAGKGTQCARIVAEYGYTHLSAGDLLRAERASGSAQGQMISEYIAEGKIVPVEVTVKLLADAIQADGGKRFLVDGFPRNTNNLSGWQQVVGDSLKVAAVLNYDCPEAVMEERLLERGKTSGRTDDNIASIKKRFKTFKDETQPVLAYYEHQGLCETIDGTRPVEVVWGDTQAFIGALEAKLGSASAEVVLHVYANSGEAAFVPDLLAKIAADATQRWGEGGVQVSGRTLSVARSLKAYDLESLRVFD